MAIRGPGAGPPPPVAAQSTRPDGAARTQPRDAAIRRARPQMPQAARVPQHEQVSGVALVSADDARADVRVARRLSIRRSGPIARVLETFGRVPFFYYLLHIPRFTSRRCIVSLVREGSVNPWLFGNHPLMNPAAAAGIHVESAAVVSRVGDRDRRAVRARAGGTTA